jgi:autotransporter-associated beta strand protein
MRAVHRHYLESSAYVGEFRTRRWIAARLRALLALAIALALVCEANGATYSWSTLSGDWSTASNWGGTLPTVNDYAYIANAGTVNVTQTGATCGTLTVGNSAGSGAVQMTGGSLTAKLAYLANGSAGAFTQSAGTAAFSSNLYLGNNLGDNGTYSLGGSAQLNIGTGAQVNGVVYIGYSGSGSFLQTGGTSTVYPYTNFPGGVYLGYNAGSSGNYSLSGSGQLVCWGSNYGAYEYVGFYGTGSFSQSGGLNTIGHDNDSEGLYLGYQASSSGTYNLSNGQLSVTSNGADASEVIGQLGTGSFTQSGGTNSISGSFAGSTLNLGFAASSSGSYTLSSSGLLTLAGTERIGLNGTGTFVQSGGQNLPGTLILGFAASSHGNYSLGAGGLLSATNEIIGNSPTASALFQQSGGTNVVATLLSIGSGGRYVLGGGTLQAAGIVNAGVFDGNNSSGTLMANGVVDMTSGTWTNLGATAVSMAANSLLIVPAGFNTSTAFGSYSTLGLTYTLGSSLNVPAGTTISSGGLSINDPVSCQGTISALSGGTINLNNGLSLAGTGNVSLGNGSLTINDSASGMSGGSLSALYQYVGNHGSGKFLQSGGTASIFSNLYLGYAAGDNGTYVLSGTSTFQTYGGGYGTSEYVGYSGSGTFTQSGGVNSVGIGDNSNLVLGVNAGGSGTYNLSGSGRITTGSNVSEIVGNDGAGFFNQSGGTNSTGVALTVGNNSGATGVYNLSGSGIVNSFTVYVGNNSGSSGTLSLSQSGKLSSTYEYVAYNAGSQGLLQQTGGSNAVDFVTIGAGGRYLLAGGTLQIAAGASVQGVPYPGCLINQGVFDGGNSPGVLNVAGSTTIDMTVGTWQNLAHTTVHVGPYSLFIVPQGFDTAHNFAAYSSLGITHTAGTTLVVPAGQGFIAPAGITITDPVNCRGTIAVLGNGNLNLLNGLNLSGTGSVAFGYGNLTVNDPNSGMSGGTLVPSNEYIGVSASGTFSQSGGSNTPGSLYVGNSPGLAGGYFLSGTGSLATDQTGYQYIGYSGSGLFVQSGGSNLFYQFMYLGYNAGSSGQYNLSGGSISMGMYYGGSEVVGLSGSGSFVQSGGNNATGDGLTLGNGSAAQGTYLLSGGSLAMTVEVVGASGAGVFTQSGGTNTIVGGLTLARFNGSSGTYNLNGGLLALSSLSAGSGTAAFNFGGGTLQPSAAMSSSLPLTLTGSGGNATVNAGYAVTLSGSLSGSGGLTKTGSGTLTLSATNTFAGNTVIGGGTLALGNARALQNSTLDTSGSGTLSFGTLSAATFGGLTGPGTLNLTNTATNPVTLSVGNNGNSTTYNGKLNGTGSLIKIGSGTLTFGGSETYSGATTINQGKLLVNGTLAGPVTVGSGGALGGTGTLNSVTVGAGGHLAPGDSPGILHLSGSLTLLSGAKMDYELDTPLGSDEVSMPTGLLSLNGQQFSDFNFTPLGGFGQGTYTLIDAGSVNGSLGAGSSGTINGLSASLAVQGNDLVLNVVPEPGTLMLLTAAAIGAVGIWRRATSPPYIPQIGSSSAIVCPSFRLIKSVARRGSEEVS